MCWYMCVCWFFGFLLSLSLPPCLHLFSLLLFFFRLFCAKNVLCAHSTNGMEWTAFFFFFYFLLFFSSSSLFFSFVFCTSTLLFLEFFARCPSRSSSHVVACLKWMGSVSISSLLSFDLFYFIIMNIIFGVWQSGARYKSSICCWWYAIYSIIILFSSHLLVTRAVCFFSYFSRLFRVNVCDVWLHFAQSPIDLKEGEEDTSNSHQNDLAELNKNLLIEIRHMDNKQIIKIKRRPKQLWFIFEIGNLANFFLFSLRPKVDLRPHSGASVWTLDGRWCVQANKPS